MEKKYFFILLLFISFLYSYGQNTGDFRSNNSITSGWSSNTSWETYDIATNLWTTALSYPGENPGTYSVTILIGDEITISSNLSTASMGDLTINGILDLQGGTNPKQISIDTKLLNISSTGVFNFSNQKTELYLPQNAVIKIDSGGDISGACSNNTKIYIDNKLIAVCNGGSGNISTFGEVGAGSGILNANITTPIDYSSTICNDIDIQLEGRAEGSTTGTVNYLWSVKDFNYNDVIISNNTSISTSFTPSIAGEYSISFTVSDGNYSNTETKTVTVQDLITEGAIGTSQNICYNSAPATLSSVSNGTASGTISYEWQTDASGSFTTIPSVYTEYYSPPTLTKTTNYQRKTVSTLNGIACYSGYTTPVTISVDDIEPVFTLSPASLTIECSASTLPADTNGPATATDNCATPTIASSDVVVNGTENNKTITRTWTATDANSNVSSYVQTITVTDTTKPVFTLSPASLTIECSASTLPADTNGPATATDNCATPTIASSDVVVNGTGNNKTITRTWTATDANSNVSSYVQTITVTDTTIPVFTLSPASLTIECSASTLPADTNGPATATDNCATPTIASSDGVVNGTGNNKTITRTWTATDANSNVSSYVQTITVTDTTKPTLTAIANRDENVGASCSFSIPDYTSLTTAADNCTAVGSIVKTQVPIAGTVSSGHNTAQIITITANDGNGNTETTTFTITLKDATPPVTPTLADVNVGQCTGTPNTPTTTDICAGTITGTTTTSFPITTQGTTVITWNFNDGNGNSTSANQNVIVDDTTNPTLTAIANRNENVGASCSFSIPNYTSLTTAADNCTAVGSIVKTQVPIAGTVISGHNTAQIITITANDGNSNTETTTFTITLKDATPPVTPTLADVNVGQCTGTPNTPTTTDICAGTITGTTTTSFPITTQGTTVITWNFNDGNGNSTSANQNVIIDDTTKPTLTAIPNRNENVGASCSFSIPNYTSLTTAADNCTAVGSIVKTQSPIAGTVISGHNTTQLITITANDGNGNTESTTFTITLKDATPPVTPTLADVNVGECSGTPTAPTTTDICAGTITGTTLTAFPITTQGTTVVNWTFADGNGNSTTVNQNVILDDITKPTLTPIADKDENIGASCSFSIPDYTSLTTAADNCIAVESIVKTQSPIAGTVISGHNTAQLITITANDGNGNTETTTFTITLKDVTKPIIACPSDLTPNVGAGTCTASVATLNPTTADNCSVTKLTWTLTGATTGASAATGINNVGTQIFNLGLTTVSYRVEDAAGNFATCSYTVTVLDNIAPTISCPSNLNPNVGTGTCTASVATLNPTTADNCSVTKLIWTLTGATTGASALTGINNLGTQIFNLGLTTVNYRVEDAAGNFANCSYTVTVLDNIAPTISCPSNLNPNVGTGTCTASVTTISPTTADNCSVTKLTWTLTGATTGASAATGINNVGTQIFNLGLTTVSYRVEDAAGNFASCSYTVTVLDNITPTIFCPSNLNRNVGTGTCTASVTTISPTTADNCSVTKLIWTLTGATTGASALTGINNVGTKVFNLGLTTVNYRVEDAAGNFTTCSYTVTVLDNIIPTISCPSNLNPNVGTGTCTASVATLSPTTADNCSVTKLTWTLTGATTGASAATGINNVGTKVFNLGLTTVNYRVEDAAGNFATCSYTVTVLDNITPTISCPSNLNRNVGTGTCTASVATISPTTADNCSVTKLTWTLTGATTGASAATGINNVGTQIFNLGLTTVNYRVEDAAGNFATCSYTVTVLDNITPTISCPSNLNPNVGTGTCTASVATISPTTADNCSVTKLIWTLTGATTGASALTGINNLGTKVFNLGLTTVNYRVEDAAGNFANCSYTVTVIDNILPTISAPTNISATTNTACTATAVVLGTPTTGDNCSVASVTNDAPTAFPIGNTTVTWTATDGSGNTKTATQLVTVTDNILPIARCKNISIVLDNTGNASITVDQINNNSSDNCGISSVVASKLLFNCGNLGNNSVTLTVTDNSGNKASCIATVTITNPAANATISISASPNTAICVGTNITFTTSTTNAGINPHYQWYKNGTPVGTDSATYSNTTLSNGETIYVELRSGPCSTYVTSNTFTAVVNDLPIVSAPSKICMGSTGSLSPTTGGTWVSNNTSIATVSNGGVITAVAPGTTTFRYTKTSTTCSNTTIPVTIYALPIVSSPTQICVNETKVLSPTTGGTWTSSNTSVATVNNAGVISGVAVGNATFTFIDGISGCSRTTTSVSVKAIPVILSASATPPTVCSGEQSTLDVLVQGASSPATTIVNYDFNTGSSYGALVSNAVAGITSAISSTDISFGTSNTGVITTGTAFTANNTAGKYLIADRPGRSWVFTLGGTDLPNYTSFKIYFQAQREDTKNTKTVKVSYKKNGAASAIIGSVSLTSNNRWYVGTFTLPAGAANPNSLEITLDISGKGKNNVRIDNFQIQGIKSGASYLYSWVGSPTATAGLPANASVPSVSNKTIPVYPTVTTEYTVTVANTDGCIETKNVTVNVYPDPKLEITADYCYGPNQVRLYANSSSPIGNLVWSTGETGPSITVDTAQYVEIVGTTPEGCTYVASLEVAQELVTNGSFTDGNTGFTSDYNYKLDGPGNTELVNDTGKNGYSITTNGQNVHNNFWGEDHTDNTVGDRNFMAVNGHGTTLVVWKETVTVQPNTTYYFSAYAMSLNSAGNNAQLRFQVNGTLVGTTAVLANHGQSNSSTDNWTRFYGTWTSGTNTTADVNIRDLQSALSGNDFGLDDISFGTLSPFLTLTSATGTDSQTVCQDNSITDITYSVGSGISAPNVTGLPSGITSSFNGITLLFTGIPTASPGTYLYTIKTTGSCGALTATGTIKINPTATVNAGTDIPVCSTVTNITMAATLGGSATSGTWSGGSGSFSNNLPNAIYTLGTGDSGKVTLTYTSNDPDSMGPCQVVSDTVDLIITPNFAAYAGIVNTTSNCADTTVTLAANGAIGQWAVTSGQAAGSYSFSNTSSPTSTFTGESGETYTLSWTITNLSPCPPSVDTVTFTIANCLNIYFDGVDDNIDFGNNFNLTNTFSFEIWAKPNALNGFTKTILSKKDITDVSTGYDLRLENNSISFYSNNSKVLTHNGINSDRWYHIAVTFDGATYKLYFDGIEMDSKNGAVPIANNYNFLVGAVNKSGNKAVNYFNGSLDELRIWNISLTNEQIRQMMNQEIIKNGNNVDGAVIPLPISALTWTNLAGYYKMNQGTSDVLGGKLNGTGFVSGRLLKMTQPQEQTAPLPYTTRADDQDWSTDETWTNYPVWNYPNSLGVNGDPIDWNIVKLSHNVKSGNKDITLLGLIIDSDKKLTIADPNQALDEKNNGQGLWITHYLKLNGAIDLVGESQLVEKRYTLTQSSESILDESSSGYIKRDQQGKKSSFNYNYWSSPVTKQNRANNAAYSITEVLRDGTASATPKAINFGDGAYFADGPVTAPIKISKRWLYSYNSPTPGSNTALQNYYLWNYIGNSVSLQVGEGFTMKGTGGPASILATQNYTFIGKPNSGTITRYIPIGQTYLLGNPYPSALDADEFIKDNLEGRAGHNVINGVLLFWDHFGTSNNHNLAQYEGGYSTYTLMGGVAGINNSPLTSNNLAQGLKAPERYIAVGQGFFVTASLDPGIKGTTATVDGGDISFKNSQRTFEREAAASSLFMKLKATDKSSIAKKDTRLKIRLGFNSTAGAHRQILVGADANTTNQFDIGYDAQMLDTNDNDMYWQFSDRQFIIQAVPNFNADQIIPFGINATKAGDATIKIDALENIPNDLEIYLYDNVNGIYHDIRNNVFPISLAAGRYDNRFSIRFANKTLDVEDFNLPESILVYYTTKEKILNIENNFINGTVNEIYLFNILGQAISNWDVKERKQTNIQIPIKNVSSGVYIVKLKATNGNFSKKIIIP